MLTNCVMNHSMQEGSYLRTGDTVVLEIEAVADATERVRRCGFDDGGEEVMMGLAISLRRRIECVYVWKGTIGTLKSE